jgi:hypothetical protein
MGQGILMKKRCKIGDLDCAPSNRVSSTMNTGTNVNRNGGFEGAFPGRFLRFTPSPEEDSNEGCLVERGQQPPTLMML